jgi:DNA-binding HxlR family transcriptional regulator
MLLARCDDGTLELFNAVAGDHLRRVILQEIKISQLTKSKFKENYGDAKGKFNLSEKALVKKLEELELAKLVTIPSRGVMELTELGESLLAL